MSAHLVVTREPNESTPACHAGEPERRPYHAPALEPLGNWTALTLSQSVCVTYLDGICLEKGGVGLFEEEIDLDQ